MLEAHSLCSSDQWALHIIKSLPSQFTVAKMGPDAAWHCVGHQSADEFVSTDLSI